MTQIHGSDGTPVLGRDGRPFEYRCRCGGDPVPSPTWRKAWCPECGRESFDHELVCSHPCPCCGGRLGVPGRPDELCPECLQRERYDRDDQPEPDDD